MELKDLKAGYLVKTKDEELYLVEQQKYGLVLVNSFGWLNVSESSFKSDYEADLTCPVNDEKDIIEVYDYTCLYNDSLTLHTDYRDLIWKRDSVKEMTIEEVEDALGYKIKLIS